VQKTNDEMGTFSIVPNVQSFGKDLPIYHHLPYLLKEKLIFHNIII